MKISDKKRDKISEQILAFLYSISPKPVFTFHIAQEVARDEEFVKSLLNVLKKKNLVIEVKKNPKGKQYTKRSRWKLSDAAYSAYKKAESNPGNFGGNDDLQDNLPDKLNDTRVITYTGTD